MKYKGSDQKYARFPMIFNGFPVNLTKIRVSFPDRFFPGDVYVTVNVHNRGFFIYFGYIGLTTPVLLKGL